MSERYSRLYALPKNLYLEGAPVIIAAVALLKDNQTGGVLAQLKFLSISPKRIKALRVQVRPLDIVNRPLGDSVEFQYLDLTIVRDDAFGQKIPLPLPDATTRGMQVAVTEVAFVDNSIWCSPPQEWTSLKTPIPLQKYFSDPEMVKQYRIAYGEHCTNPALIDRNIWYCNCGAINQLNETICHFCRQNFDKVTTVDLDALSTACNDRLAEIERRETEQTKKAAETARKKKKITICVCITISFILLCLGVYIVYNSYIQPLLMKNSQYDAAVVLMEEGEYAQAISKFGLLRDFKDSKENITICQNAIKEDKYLVAIALMDEGQYEKAMSIFSNQHGYKDCKEKFEECKKAIATEKAISAIKKLSSAKTGDTISLGKYEQDGQPQEKEDIEWLVLDVQDGKAFIVSKAILACRKFHENQGEYFFNWTTSTWKTCDLRTWLNQTFLNDAFSQIEQSIILTSTVSPDKNPIYDTSPGGETQDKIFLLSITEVKQYLGDTATCEKTILSTTANDWWLRTPGKANGYTATATTALGHISEEGINIGTSGVRPAMWILLGE